MATQRRKAGRRVPKATPPPARPERSKRPANKETTTALAGALSTKSGWPRLAREGELALRKKLGSKLGSMLSKAPQRTVAGRAMLKKRLQRGRVREDRSRLRSGGK